MPVSIPPHVPNAVDHETEAEQELNRLQAGFPRFRIWREITGDRTTYVARSQDLGAHPHTVVTTDLDELRVVLSAGAQCPGGAG